MHVRKPEFNLGVIYLSYYIIGNMYNGDLLAAVQQIWAFSLPLA